nr:hypothetical protein [Crateriforma spongiae]
MDRFFEGFTDGDADRLKGTGQNAERTAESRLHLGSGLFRDATGTFQFSEQLTRVGDRFANGGRGRDAEHSEDFIELGGAIGGSESFCGLCDFAQDIDKRSCVASRILGRDPEHLLKLLGFSGR